MKGLVQFINEAKMKVSQSVIEKFTELFGELGEVTTSKDGMPEIKLANNKNMPCVKLKQDKDKEYWNLICNPKKCQFVDRGMSGSYTNVGVMANSKIDATPEEFLDQLIERKNKDPKKWEQVINSFKEDKMLDDDLDTFVLGRTRK